MILYHILRIRSIAATVCCPLCPFYYNYPPTLPVHPSSLLIALYCVQEVVAYDCVASKTNSKEVNMDKKKVFALIGCAIAMLSILICLLHSCRPEQTEPLQELLTPDTNAVSQVNTEPSGAAKMPSIEIPGYGSITLKAGQTAQNVSFPNPAENNCYFVISLYLPDGSLIYQSGLIPPAKAIYSIELLQTVSAGTYENAIMQYDCYRLDDQSQLNGARTHLTLIFE